MKFGFGENDKLGKIDFSKLPEGLTKEDLGISDDFKKSLFDSIDTDNSGTLSKDEISIFEKKIKELAGYDEKLSIDEAGLFKLGEKQLKDMETYEEGRIDSDGNALLHQKIDSFFSFLEALSSKTEGINGVKHKSDCQVIKYENGIEEIQYTNGRIVIKENNKVIYDSEAKVVEEKTTNVTDAEFYMINYLKNQIKTAKYIIETADDNTSITGALVDWWCRLDILWMENNHPLDKMDEVVKELERNVLALEKAAKNSPEEYNRVCKEKFGIDFNAAAVEEFMLQANEYSLISQQQAIYDIVCHSEKYRGGHGHAAADETARYGEDTKNFLLVCESMGYDDLEIQDILTKTVERYNESEIGKKNPYKYASWGPLQNPDNNYIKAQRVSGGFDVAEHCFTAMAFDILRERVEADLNKLHNTNSFENFYKQKTDEYNAQLKKVFGFCNVVDGATGASEEYQGDVASLNNAFMMITMVASLASGGIGILATFAKGLSTYSAALNAWSNVLRVTSGVNKYLSVAGMAAATNPIEFTDKLLSENGMTADAFASWGKGVLQNCAFMGLGMAASNFAMRFGSWYKAGRLAKVCKKGGHTFDDLMNAVKSSPQKFPPDLVKSLNSINRSSMMLQISAETLMDFGFSAAGGYAMMGDDYKIGSMDFWMSLAFSINGGFNEKIMRELNTQNAKVKYINDALEKIKGMSLEDQNSILDNFRRENNIDMDNAKLREQFKDFKLDKKEITKMVAEDDNFKAYTLASMIYGKDGCILQKKLSVLSNDAKAKYVQDALMDFNLSYEDAWRVVKYMDVIAKGEKIEQGKQLDKTEVIYKKVKQRSVSEEMSRLAEIEEIDLPTRVRGLDDVVVKENSAPEAQTTTKNAYIPPEAEILSFEPERMVATDDTGVKPNDISVKPDAKALELAKSMGFTDAEIKVLSSKNAVNIELLEGLKESKGFKLWNTKKLYLEYPDKAKLLDETILYKVGDSENFYEDNNKLKFLTQMLKAEVSIDDALNIISKICPEKYMYLSANADVINKVINLNKAGKLDTEMCSFIYKLSLDKKQTSEMIDYIQALRDNGSIDSKTLEAIVIALQREPFHSTSMNYKDAVDFIVDNKDLANIQITIKEYDSSKELNILSYVSDLINKELCYDNGLTLEDVKSYIEIIKITKEAKVGIGTNFVKELATLYRALDFEKYPQASEFILNIGCSNSFYLKGIENLTSDCLDTLFSSIEKYFEKKGEGLEEYHISKLIRILTDSNPETISFVKKVFENSSKNLQLGNIETVSKCLKAHPEIYKIIEKHVSAYLNCYISDSASSNLDFLIESKVSDDVLKFVLEPSGHREIPLNQSELTFLIGKHPDFIEVINKRKELKSGKIAYSSINDLISGIGVQNLDLINYILTAENKFGKARFESLYVSSSFTLDQATFTLDKIKALAELKNPNGMYSFDNLEDIVKLFKIDEKSLELFFDATPPEKELDAYTLYDRVFKEQGDVVKKYGCSSFKEFEEKIKTLPPEERREAGKLLGQIKKQTIDTFLTGLSDKAVFLLSSSNGAFSAKDLDDAIKLFNEKPILRRYLVDLEKDGKISDTFEMTQLEELAITGDSRFFDIYCNDIDSDPVRAKKLLAEYSKLHEIMKEKAINYLKNNQEVIEAFNGDLELAVESDLPLQDYVKVFSRATKVLPLGKISALIHNESIMKIMSYLDHLGNIYRLDEALLSRIKMLFTKPNFQDDNNVKALISLISVYQKLDVKMLDDLVTSIERENLTMAQVNEWLFSKIKEASGLNSALSETDLSGWDMEYMPHVLNLLNEGFNNYSIDKVEDANILKSLIKTSLEGGYWESLLDPNTPNGMRNIESARIFKEENLDMEQFLHYDGVVEMDFRAQQVSTEPIKISTIEDFGKMLEDPKLKSVFEPFLRENNINVNFAEKTFTINGTIPTRQDLLNLMSKMNKFINDNSSIVAESSCPDVKDHFVARRRSLSQVIDTSKGSGKVTVSLWKRDVRHDLFQGHYCQCCVSTDGINNHSIVETLGHTVDQIAELKDPSGQTVGKVKMLFLKNTSTGEPILLANGFEIIPPYAFDNNVRSLFVDFMKNYSVAVAGKELPIYTGVTYQKINYDDLGEVEGEFLLLGKTPNDTYHLDSYSHSGEGGSHPKDLDKPHTLKLKVMYQPE